MKIKLDMFEGPLDLLLHLIEEEEIDIYDVPLARVTEQYMQVLFEAQQLELEVASEFLVMATTLLMIKSRELLPSPASAEEEDGTETDPRQELVERLLEYKRYKRLSHVLKQKEEDRGRVYSPTPMDLCIFTPTTHPLQGITPDGLLQVFVGVLQNIKPKEHSHFVEREEIPLATCIEEVCAALRNQGSIFFSTLFTSRPMSKEHIITIFLAVLELIKTKHIVCRQMSPFGDILIEMAKAEVSA